MRRTPSYEYFLRDFEERSKNRRLYGFILFDDRPSHKAVAKFTEDNFDWLDQLADGANMYVYAFSHLGKKRRRLLHLGKNRYRLTSPETEYARNPSVKVASLFGIRPNQLPGILLFTMLPKMETADLGIFVPLDAKLFVKDENEIEYIFSDLFSMLQRCQEHTLTNEELFRSVSYSIDEIRTSKTRRGVAKYICEASQSISQFPAKFVEAVCEAWAKAIISSGLPLF